MTTQRHHKARRPILVLAIIISAAADSMCYSAVAAADPPIAPAPPPVIGPLQYGPPGYPPAIGVPLLPQARAGVTTSADTVDPAAQSPLPGSSANGIGGVRVAADAISPVRPGPS